MCRILEKQVEGTVPLLKEGKPLPGSRRGALFESKKEYDFVDFDEARADDVVAVGVALQIGMEC
ncbi:MAG: hypothetical protein AB9886_02055 [Candidatus Cryosericum sp.]